MTKMCSIFVWYLNDIFDRKHSMNGGLCLMFVLAAPQVGEASSGKMAQHNLVMIVMFMDGGDLFLINLFNIDCTNVNKI